MAAVLLPVPVRLWIFPMMRHLVRLRERLMAQLMARLMAQPLVQALVFLPLRPVTRRRQVRLPVCLPLLP